MVECPQSHKTYALCAKIHTKWLCQAVTTSHKGSQTVTKSHLAPAPAHSEVTQHRKITPGTIPRALWESQSVTKSHWAQHQRILQVTKQRKVASVPPWWVQNVTKLHGAPDPRRSGSHKTSQTVAKSHLAAAPAHSEVTKRHKVTPGTSPRALWESQSVTKSHWAPAPAHSGSHQASHSSIGAP